MEFIRIVYLFLICGICVYTDVRMRKIKNVCIVAILAGAGLFLIPNFQYEVVIVLKTMLIWGVALLALYGIGVMGAGDVKLLWATACYVGRDHLGPFFMGTMVAGGVLALVQMIRGQIFFGRMRYLGAYIRNVLATGTVTRYGMPDNKEETMPLAVPAMAGVICWAVCILCE